MFTDPVSVSIGSLPRSCQSRRAGDPGPSFPGGGTLAGPALQPWRARAIRSFRSPLLRLSLATLPLAASRHVGAHNCSVSSSPTRSRASSPLLSLWPSSPLPPAFLSSRPTLRSPRTMLCYTILYYTVLYSNLRSYNYYYIL